MAVQLRTPPITEDRGFWSIFAAAMAVALASAAVPQVIGSIDANWNIRVSYFCAAIWFALQTFAIVRHRLRGMWLMIGLPVVLYWPIAFKLLEYACRHNVNACL